MDNWSDCKEILCIRTDNMGDLLMSTPAIRALKETFGCRITLLAASASADIASLTGLIDAVIVFNAPWNREDTDPAEIFSVLEEIRSRRFDAAVIFTVYSQNPLPAALFALMAGIPKRLAYCRENPYGLLTGWIPDQEPYTFIRHQVKRDLDLVASVGAVTSRQQLSLCAGPDSWKAARNKALRQGIRFEAPWMVVHTGVSEKKREYPTAEWVAAGRKIREELGLQLLFTGTAGECGHVRFLIREIGEGAFSLAGLLSLDELAALIGHAPLLLSVNTVTIHMAAALGTPVVVLYALTNPQHTPWKVSSRVLTFDVPPFLRSKNEVVRYVHQHHLSNISGRATPDDILQAVRDLLSP
ncbi:glycosyltransferase family 9 protein [Compostibacter hankyongensis]